MKKLIFNVLGCVILATSLLLTSCEKDETSTPIVITSLDDGIMNGTLTEDFTLDASVQYNLTGSFIIPAGKKLTIPAGSNIIADAGGTGVFIAVLKGGMIDILGTETNPVVMTSSDAEPGDWGGLTICGNASTTAGVDAEAEVGGFIYGGTNDADNSGSIKYLVIKGTGAQINQESQYNGVSFYAVGSETKVENLAVINGADDGVEFFGGSVSVTNLFLQNNEDDAIDWTEGWNGTITNSYVEHTVAGFSTVVEGDKVNNNPKLVNLTAVSTVGGTALQFKKESGATITGLSLSGYEVSIDMKDDGALSNVIIGGENANPDSSYVGTPTVDVSAWTWTNAEVVEVLSGNVSGDVSLDASKSYRLTGAYIVEDGASLTIPAGTKIVADAGGTSVYIAVLMGGTININGTVDAPVVIASDNSEPGDWGGLTICGKATTSAGVDATAEVGGFKYGGTSDDDNSGSISFLVIKGTGAQINSESQYNGISLYAVGSGTTIEKVAVIDGADDGIEFFGGTVSVTNIYLENNEDDAVDWTEGWSGTITNTYILHSKDGFSTAFEGDKVNSNPKFVNVTAICTATGGGTALQFKKESGATISNLYLEGYTKNIDMKDGGALANVQIDGVDADPAKDYSLGTKVDADAWTWKGASL